MTRRGRALPKETLAANLNYLMELREWNPYDLARASGVSQKTIWNILNQATSPHLDTVDRLAAAFNLTLWHLIMPNLPSDLLTSPSLEHLVAHYARATPDDRILIDRVAERASSYEVDTTDDDPDRLAE